MADYFSDPGTWADQHEWPDVVYPYIKNGTTAPDSLGTLTNLGQGGVWACPSFPTSQIANYGINWELCRNGAGTWGYWNVSKVIKTVSQAQIDSPADKYMLIEKGQAPCGAGNFPCPVNNYAEMYFDPTEGFYTANIGPFVNGQPTGADTHVELLADVDSNAAGTNISGAAATAFGQSSWANWSVGPEDLPRYRHNGVSNTLFSDGHVKAVPRGGLNWFKNVYIPKVYEDLEGVSGPA